MENQEKKTNIYKRTDKYNGGDNVSIRKTKTGKLNNLIYESKLEIGDVYIIDVIETSYSKTGESYVVVQKSTDGLGQYVSGVIDTSLIDVYPNPFKDKCDGRDVKYEDGVGKIEYQF